MRNLHRTLVLACLAVLIAPALAAGLSSSSTVNLDDVFLPDGTVQLPPDAQAIPLSAPSPEDVTPEVLEKAMEASKLGLAYDMDLDKPVALVTNFLFIRPGAWMVSPAWCTMNFIYGTPGSYKIGTAGHCASGNQWVALRIAYPPSLNLLVYIGQVDASTGDGGVGNDWAIVNILPVWQPYVDTDTAEIMGPEGGSYAGTAGLLAPRTLKHFGHGLVVGTGGTPRAGASPAMPGCTVYFWGAAAPGDSGSPILMLPANDPLGGQAVGVLTHLVIFGSGVTVIAGTRIVNSSGNSCVGGTVADGNGSFIS